MRIAKSLFLLCSICLHRLSFSETRSHLRRNLGEHDSRPKPPPNSSGSSGGGTSSGGGSSGGGSSGSSSSSSSGSGGGSSSGGSFSGGSNHASNSGGGSSSSSTGSRNRMSQNNGKAVSDVRSEVGVIIGLVGAAALVSALLVAAFRRRTTIQTAHPLKGSISRRMNLFNNMAKHNPSASRPPRRVEDVYIPAPGDAVGV
ncbi:hypothetical protein FisN_17Lu153 [Fistulifera solaris]|uniref:Uncharacterized protein n=1 Tax=Fistulifera solaris TaxID=1519565 RepID=A0A1Z5K1F8_FISSO|nr:hypothetical protein FisN_17Lu153 [Fistulifera solaris]|eukprot:GAX20134.1 hypothetical protein FisN_17Lu153 [Fistulifera solaris]